MTEEEFKNLGNGQHHQVIVEWNGKKWRMTETKQISGSVKLQPLESRMKHGIWTGYAYVKLIG